MAGKSTPVYSEEIKIDLGKYIETLIRQWAWIIGCALLLGIAAVAVSQGVKLASPTYRATALIASSKTVSVVNFGGAISSQSETDLAAAAASGAQYLYDRKARLQSYVTLVRNGSVAEQVLAQVRQKLKPEEQNTAALLEMVRGNLVVNTDSIQISVTYSNPAVAAEIANDWAKAYVQLINDLYGDTSAGISAASFQGEISKSKADYDAAQKALSDFETQNTSAEYQRQITQLTAIVTDLRDSLSAVASQQVQYGTNLLKQDYTEKLNIQQFLNTVASMREAVKKGGEPAAISNSLALTLLKTQIYAAFQGSNSLQVQNLPEAMGSTISTVNAAAMFADLDALSSTLNARATELDAEISTLSKAIQNGSNLSTLDNAVSLSAEKAPLEAKITASEQKIRDLTAQVNSLNARENELTKARDLAFQSYSALVTKSTEMSVAAQTTGSEVVFASVATPPEKTVIRSTFNAGIGVAAGLLIGIFSAYAYEFWQSYKSRPIEALSKRFLRFLKNIFQKKSKKSPPMAAQA